MRTRRGRRVALGATVVGILMSTPVVALAAVQAGPGGQPPPGTSVPKTADITLGTQPAPGTSMAKTTETVIGEQPANPDPQEAGPAVQLQHSTDDAGAQGLAPTQDQGIPNLPAQAE